MPAIRWIKEISNCFTSRACNMALSVDLHNLKFAIDLFKTEDMCHEAVRRKPRMLRYALDHLKKGNV